MIRFPHVIAVSEVTLDISLKVVFDEHIRLSLRHSHLDYFNINIVYIKTNKILAKIGYNQASTY